MAVAPRLIGGGDWKLLVVLGAVIGFLAPASASVVPMAAFGAAAVAAAARHRRHVRLGPFLAAGYVVAIVATVVEPELFGSWYLGTIGGLMKTLQDAKETRLSNSTIAATASPRGGGRSCRTRAGAHPQPRSASKPGLRMRPHRPMRALAGALIVVASVVAALALYTRIGDRTEVLAVSRDVLAGEQIDDADLEVVSMSSDDGIPTIPASQRAAIVGQYARVRLLAGSLLAADSVQPRPLVDPDRVLMSVVVPVGLVPVGLREQSRVVLVVTPPTSGGVRPAPVLVEAVVASVPRNLGEVVGSADAGQGMVALAVEVPPQYVGVVGEAEAVSVGVLDGRRRSPTTRSNPRQNGPQPAANRCRRRGSTPLRPPARAGGQPRRPDDDPDGGPDDDRAAGMTIVAVCAAADRPPRRRPPWCSRRCSRRATRRCSPSATRPAATSPPGRSLPTSPGWSTAVSGADRSGRRSTTTPSSCRPGLRVMAAPARASQAHTAVGEAARGFAGLIAAAPDVVTVADCGRVDLDAPLWATSAQLTLLLVRQSVVSAPATVPRVDRAIEALGVLRSTCRQVGVVLIGGAPYRSSEVAGALGTELFGVLPEDAAGAALVAGGWTVGKRASRSPLAKAAASLGERVVEAIYGRDHRPEQLWSAEAVDDACTAAPTDRPDVRRTARRPAPSARASDRRHRRQARRPQGPGVAQRRLADVA